MRDLFPLAWLLSFGATFASLAAFLVAYSMFGHVLLTNVYYFGYAFFLSGVSFLALTILGTMLKE